MTPMKGKGCATCSNKGYKGRLALYQIMPITEDIRLAILRGASTDELRKMTIDQGVKTIRTSGITKVCQGITTQDRKSTRLNSSHQINSYALFCLKKKKTRNVAS